MKGYRLSQQAERTLEDIIGWTIDHFGIDQAIQYKKQLIDRLSLLAADDLIHGRSCNVLLGKEHNVKDLEYYRVGKHYIIYRNTEYGIWVADFVHGSRDLEVILQDII